MKVAIDVDGVLANQVPPVLRLLNRKYGLNVRKRNIRRWDEPIADTDIKVEIEGNLLNPNFLNNMRLINGAKDAANQISKKHYIVIATNRDPKVVIQTQNWLNRKGIPFNEFISTKIEGKGAVDADVLIDDYPGNIVEFQAKNRYAILFDQPWNREFDIEKEVPESKKVYRAHGWKEVLRFLSKIQNNR